MERTSRQYELLVSDTEEITQTILDMDGGRYILSMLSELLIDLIDTENIDGATIVAQKLYEAAEVELWPIDMSEDEAAVWIGLFSEMLAETLEENC